MTKFKLLPNYSIINRQLTFIMLKKWQLKAIIQKGISYLPYKTNINFFIQKYITKKILLTDDFFEKRMIHARDHLDFFKKNENNHFEEKTALELSYDQYPIISIAIFLSGFDIVISLNNANLVNKKTIVQTLKMFVEWRKKDKLEEYLENINDQRWEQLQEVISLQKKLNEEQICRILRLKLMSQDARNTKLPAQSIDFIISNNIYEHTYPLVLKFILKEFKRILAPQGIMSHFVDLSDHFAHFDKNITIYNFLKYSEKQWQKIDNSIQPQNRLRWKDYEKMYQDLEIIYTSEKLEKGDLKALATVSIHEMFNNFDMEELAISHGYLVTS